MSSSEAKGRERERADVLDFMRHPPGNVPERMRAFLADLVAAVERGDHVGSAKQLLQEETSEALPSGWEWKQDDDGRHYARGPAINLAAHRFVEVREGGGDDGEDTVEFQYEIDREPLAVVRAVIARHDRERGAGRG